MGLGGLEPPTSPLSGVRSNHLSYRPGTGLSVLIHQTGKRVDSTRLDFLVVKEVIQPQVPLRLPCYDFTPVADRTVVKGISFALRCNQLPWCDGRCVQDPGTYSPRHSDSRLLAIPTSWSRVADSNPDYEKVSEISYTSRLRGSLSFPL